MSLYWCERAWLPDGIASRVLIEVRSGRVVSVGAGVEAPEGATRLAGLVLPGLANAHSHAFHRALRGRTHGEGGTFWTWRELMYAVAARLDPDSYRVLATAVFAEMAAAGVTCVGEFHYLHHRVDGSPYPDPNAMGLALVDAAAAAGLRITLLDTCYLAGGLGEDGHLPLAPQQRRFGDGDPAGWRERVSRLSGLDGHARLGAAIHSIRAVTRQQIPDIVATATDLGLPLHVHLSEQPAENEACEWFYGCSPTELLAEAGALGPNLTAVHAVHLSPRDIQLLGGSGTAICACPTTEADLADGVGPFPALLQAGSPLCLGSDQHAHVDLIEESRRLEQHQRLVSGNRGTFSPADLVDALTAGHRALGWNDAGRLEVGARADLVAIDLASVRTAGARPDQVVLAASSADVSDVVIDGVEVVRGRRHRLGDVGALLSTAIADLWPDTPECESPRQQGGGPR